MAEAKKATIKTVRLIVAIFAGSQFLATAIPSQKIISDIERE